MLQAKRSLDSEVLISAAIVASGSAEVDSRCIRDASTALAGYAQFYEVLVVSATPAPDWIHAIETVIAECENVRLILLEDAYDFELYALAALTESIGDYVALVYAGEIDARLIPEMVDKARSGSDVVKLEDIDRGSMYVARGAAWALRLLTGYRTESGILRSLCLSRRGIAAISARRGDEHYFRFVDLESGYRQVRMPAAQLTRRRSWQHSARRARIVLDLIGHAAPRLLKSLALVAFAVALMSLAYGGYAFLLWMLRDSVAEGWTSISMVLALMFGFAFVLLAVVAVGVARTLEAVRHAQRYAVAREIGRTDLFGRFDAINVEKLR